MFFVDKIDTFSNVLKSKPLLLKDKKMIRVKYDKLYVVDPDQFEIICINDTLTATDADCVLDTPGTLNNDIIFQGSMQKSSWFLAETVIVVLTSN
jgi:hypothetical protein